MGKLPGYRNYPSKLYLKKKKYLYILFLRSLHPDISDMQLVSGKNEKLHNTTTTTKKLKVPDLAPQKNKNDLTKTNGKSVLERWGKSCLEEAQVEAQED